MSLPTITITDELKSEITAKHQLKHVETMEKTSLPSKEVIEKEKSQLDLLKSIVNFDVKSKLKPTITLNKVVLPTKDIMKEEKQANKK
uniref:Thymosin beta n=1 Tax=Tetranychus urticae TaxID=32264 RepID=T1JU84_TETUR